MNRQEFCQIIVDIRKQSTIKMKDICFQMGVMPTAIYRLEKGSGNFEMGNMMSYIKALQHILVIENGQQSYRTHDAQELGSILALIRKEKAMSQRALAEKTGCSHLTIANIERKTTTISIDTLLKTVAVLGYTIKIEKQ
ncbi:helix-turn-helix domain-containing protein [Bacteroides ovatus]|uniref:Helix-turn-helix domain-containing protein n=1 Tax=Bacteroides faecis TaxID=674529 RepID=A0ABY5T5Y2_9BACE|nr:MULTISPECIES: helix-turn-helix transcriptional regulator [Bacteroides]MCE9211803.1 helix-turn-helix domain-containing protein [Bacteroides ovatus]UVQ73264.1 helix-turn-helix domain-containing protein [Bacteroides faecis]